ncbi:Zinc-binding GTPase YeiR [Pseudomonas fluorescens]|uniref:CobW family GTP-binding protein n=1 Tax=Pseudomonas fluorescens TaxID=294 RepID=UPI0012518FFD|nr:CobW-like GTP-binding protein [Pseudomonas fluorescens]CAG8869229.1 Zinc-binding GTPase YeiR [Pseudomonas fluorescens]VVP71971.1 Zinc-binding GTPase YeiR [Pseudomonas fluorescens]
MLKYIPTHVIAGPLGAGKTSLIRHLLAQRPEGERWAVLVNEFGQIGLDAALLSCDADGITISEVAGGCLCCVNGVPFQVGLGRLLRKARPDRLLIEPSGLGHPAELIMQLGRSPWTGVLDLQPLVMVLDAMALTAGRSLSEAQRQALELAKLIVINKSSAVDKSEHALISRSLPQIPSLWTDDGYVNVDNLPRNKYQQADLSTVDKLPFSSDTGPQGGLWINPGIPLCVFQPGDGGWSIGWRWHPSQRFESAAVDNFLRRWSWRRAKMVIHSTAGWQSLNALDGQASSWQTTEWRKDSRIELIFDQPQTPVALQQALQDCLAD